MAGSFHLSAPERSLKRNRPGGRVRTAVPDFVRNRSEDRTGHIRNLQLVTILEPAAPVTITARITNSQGLEAHGTLEPAAPVTKDQGQDARGTLERAAPATLVIAHH